MLNSEKFRKMLQLRGKESADSTIESTPPDIKRQIFIKLSKEDRAVNIFKSIEGIFDIYCQSKHMADFLDLQDQFKPPALKGHPLLDSSL